MWERLPAAINQSLQANRGWKPLPPSQFFDLGFIFNKV
jgi:hypothetical protein